jgi:hypothetical protein
VYTYSSNLIDSEFGLVIRTGMVPEDASGVLWVMVA